LSKRNRDLALSNVHKVSLGPGGYQNKADQRRREREAIIAAGLPDPFQGLTDRGWFWLEARKFKIVDGKPHFDEPQTKAVAQKMYELTDLQSQEKFKAKRDKDVLSTALGSKEHGGRVRGVSSKLSFKDGFQEDRSTYKRHDRYKEEMIQAAEQAAESKFREMFAQIVEHQSGQIVMMPPPVLAQSNSTCAQSGVASTTAQPYLVDSVTSTTPCMLLYPIGRAEKTKEVAKAHVDPAGALFEGKPIPPLYARVRVQELLK